jgi:ornithine cyclodeaminase/alanine dehydrogenase-like protein (mu-crystallin family)
MLHLDDDRIAALVDPGDAERAVWSAFAAWGAGEAATTQRVRAIPAAGGVAAGMASAMAAVVPPYCGGKLYATAAGRFTFVIVLFRTDGALLCTLDGDAITRLRTAAASSLAIAHLAAPGASTAAVIGTGIQAWSHIEMLGRALPSLTELRVCSRPESAAAGSELVERAVATGLPASASLEPAAAVDGAQVVVTVTSSTTPLFPASVVADDALLCAVGATKYDRAEIGPDVVERCAAVVCDDAVGSRVECGDLLQAAAAGRFDWDRAVELHAVAAGTVSVDRAGIAGPVLFETQGVALQDVAVAGLAWERHSQN